MSFKQLVRRVSRLEDDMYSSNGSGCKASLKSLKSSFKMLKFMFCAILSLQVVMISILLIFISAGT